MFQKCKTWARSVATHYVSHFHSVMELHSIDATRRAKLDSITFDCGCGSSLCRRFGAWQRSRSDLISETKGAIGRLNLLRSSHSQQRQREVIVLLLENDRATVTSVSPLRRGRS